MSDPFSNPHNNPPHGGDQPQTGYGQNPYGQSSASDDGSAGYGQSSASPYGQDPAQQYGQAGSSVPQYGQSSASGYGQDSYGQSSASGYGQDSQPYGQSSAPTYGQSSAPDAAQPGAQQYGQSSAPSFDTSAPQYGQQPTGWDQPPAGGPSLPPVGPKPKRRGVKRMIFGGIIVVLAGIGMIIGLALGGVIGMAVALNGLSDDKVTTLDPGEQVQLTSGIYYVGSTDSGATCAVDGGGSATEVSDSGDNSSFPMTKDGKNYYTDKQVTVTGETSVTITCDKGEAAIAPVGMGPMIAGLLIGLGIPALIGLIGLILLIVGIVVYVRSGRQAPQQV